MATVIDQPTMEEDAAILRYSTESMAELVARLGDIPLSRIRLRPAPGTATLADALWVNDRKLGLVELVEGVLIEKAMGLRESLVGIALASLLREFVVSRNLGLVTGADGPLQLFPGLVRMPDVAYIAWQQIPGGRVPQEPMPLLGPTLAVEILSAANTRSEMQRKRREYFDAGAKLIWMIDIVKRQITVYTSVTDFQLISGDAVLSGGDVLPGFEITLPALFAELDRLNNRLL